MCVDNALSELLLSSGGSFWFGIVGVLEVAAFCAVVLTHHLIAVVVVGVRAVAVGVFVVVYATAMSSFCRFSLQSISWLSWCLMFRLLSSSHTENPKCS